MKAVTESFKMSKDAGFKVVTHMMPDLPNVGLERDIEQFIVSLLFSVKSIKHQSLLLIHGFVAFCVFFVFNVFLISMIFCTFSSVLCSLFK